MMNNRKKESGYRQTSGRWNSDVQEPEEPSEIPRRKPARDCALTLLEYRDRTEQEMRGKLNAAADLAGMERLLREYLERQAVRP